MDTSNLPALDLEAGLSGASSNDAVTSVGGVVIGIITGIVAGLSYDSLSEG
jgi:hypothetical protein